MASTAGQPRRRTSHGAGRRRTPLRRRARAHLPRRDPPRYSGHVVVTSAAAARRHGWIDILQISGPFLTVPVADATWPSGIPAVPSETRARVRAAVSALLADGGVTQRDTIGLVLSDALGWGDAL